ncbi:alpha/beta family hydrolase [Roseivirga sp. BDSF3-8]|uniref:alpha/beta hydrolase family protein n=1 Tax=Roseivirga sp. BDSF3-8 TaxID=3241598 RepID=UPI003531F0B8
MSNVSEYTFLVGDDKVRGMLTHAENAKCLLVLSHGAGAGMTHPFMETLSHKLQASGVSVFRFNFPYMEKGRKAPGSQRQAIAAMTEALKKAATFANGLPLLLGGKSYGGRMASHLMAEESVAELTEVKGLIFFGFPLHAPGKKGKDRAAHLQSVSCPMLFLQGGRDKLADPVLIDEVAKGLCGATIKMYEHGDHSFHVLKRSGTTDEVLMDEIVTDTNEWLSKVL